LGIVNSKTTAVIDHIVASNEYEKRYPGWGRASWEMGSNEVTALLGTPNGAGIAYLLAQHKTHLGRKTLGKVHLVYNEDDSNAYGRKTPSLVFEHCDTIVDTDGSAAPGPVTGDG
jgi:hypothetical protein